jgi:photosystem II stability/assembly factor-like uncharacterized protein
MIRRTIVAASIVLGLVACGGGGDRAARGTGIPAKKLGSVPNAIAFWNPGHGLLGTGTCAGTTFASCRSGTIRLTSNGGRSFRVVLRTRRRVLQLQTAGPHGAIATTDRGVFRTLDGGRSWKRFPQPAGGASTKPGSVTRDRGIHWHAEPKVAQPELDFGRGAAAFAGGHGLVLLGRGGSLPARLLATDDAGRTWHLVHRWS